MHWLMVLLDLSLEPSVLGSYAEESFSLTPVNLCGAHQNFKTKILSQSEMISLGNLFSQYQWLKNKTARSSVVMSVQVGIIWLLEPRWSVIDRMQSKLPLSGKGPIKSVAMLSSWSSGIRRGCKGPEGLCVLDLFLRHSVHEGMYAFSRSHHMFGQ